MIRSLVAASAAVLTLAACGGSSGNGSAAPPAAPAGPTGTILGQPFTPADGSALVLAQATCRFDGVDASATGLLLGFGTFQGLCSLVTDTKACGTKANGTIVTAVIVRANVTGGTAPPVAIGTYSISASSPSPDAQGNVVLAQAVVARNDATCKETSGIPAATSGTLRIDAITAERVTGNADLTFQDGSHVAGAFDVARCGYQTDVCTALDDSSCTSRTCVP